MTKKTLSVGGRVTRKKFPSVVYGLQGIMELFDISKSTAWRYRHSIIKDACTQNGNVIVVDVRKAFKLFGMDDPDSLVSDMEHEE